MATRAEVNQLAAKSFYLLLRKTKNKPYLFSFLIRAIIHTAKKENSRQVAKEMIKEIYLQLESKDPQNSREFLLWFRSYAGITGDNLFNSSVQDAEKATSPVDVQ